MSPKRSQEQAQLDNQPVKINVGGQIFWTTRTTLTSTSGHILSRIFADGEERGVQGTAMRDENGVAFIDREPRHFHLVLNFLRDGWVPLPPTEHERQQLRQEALFYGLTPLADQIEESLGGGGEEACKAQAETTDSLLTSLSEGIERVGTVLEQLPLSGDEEVVAALACIGRRIKSLRRTVAETQGGEMDSGDDSVEGE